MNADIYKTKTNDVFSNIRVQISTYEVHKLKHVNI